MLSIYYALITLGSVARLTRLAARDAITAPLRSAVLYNRDQRAALRRGDPVPAPTRPRVALGRAWAFELIRCVWCVSVWISLAVVALIAICGPHPVLVFLGTALSLSYATGLIAQHEQPNTSSREP